MAELNGELLQATQTNLSALRETSSRLTEELERVRNQLADDLSNTAYTANREAEFVKSDITREVHEQDDKIQEAVGKVKTEIYFLNAQLEGLKFDITKYIIGRLQSDRSCVAPLTLVRDDDDDGHVDSWSLPDVQDRIGISRISCFCNFS